MSDPTEFPKPLSEAEAKARSKRNIFIAVCLVGFMVVIFAITMVRLQEDVVREQDWEKEIGKTGTDSETIQAGEGSGPNSGADDE